MIYVLITASPVARGVGFSPITGCNFEVMEFFLVTLHGLSVYISLAQFPVKDGSEHPNDPCLLVFLSLTV